MLYRHYITAEMKMIIEKYYPCVIDDITIRNFVMYLLFGAAEKDWETGDLQLRLSHKDIAVLTNNNIHHNDWSSGEFIKKIQSLKEFQDLEIEEYVPKYKCRLIKKYTIPEAVKKALDIEKSKRQKNTIHYATGTKITKQKAADIKKQNQKIIESWSQIAGVTDDQKYVLNYLNNLDERIFNSKIDKNFEKAEKEIINYCAEDETKKNKYLNLLSYIRQDSKPLYYTVAGSHRLFSRGSITSLIKPARKALCSGWIDFDLKSAYIAILSKILKSEETNKVLDIGVWEYLKSHNINKTNTLKQVMYSLCFGKSLKKIKIENINDENILKLIELPFIKDIKEKCNLKLKEIMKQYNCSHKIARGSLAKLVSKIELKLLKPVFELANEKKYFNIVLYQFDGVTVSVTPDKASHAINLLTKTINAKIKELGYKTELTYEIL